MLPATPCRVGVPAVARTDKPPPVARYMARRGTEPVTRPHTRPGGDSGGTGSLPAGISEKKQIRRNPVVTTPDPLMYHTTEQKLLGTPKICLAMPRKRCG
jgi:hypothetical protein